MKIDQQLEPPMSHRKDFPRLLKLLRHFGVPVIFRVEIYHRQADAMFHFAFADVVQVALPITVLFQVYGHVFGYEDVTGIAAIHHPLRDVNSGSGNIGAATYVHHSGDRPAMNSHAQLQLVVVGCSAADVQRALHWVFRSVVEKPAPCRHLSGR